MDAPALMMDWGIMELRKLVMGIWLPFIQQDYQRMVLRGIEEIREINYEIWEIISFLMLFWMKSLSTIVLIRVKYTW